MAQQRQTRATNGADKLIVNSTHLTSCSIKRPPLRVMMSAEINQLSGRIQMFGPWQGTDKRRNQPKGVGFIIWVQ